ncbi:hypothetical protein SLS56_011798 [Neofusicoccum ribis]|uniref:Rhodopsin domain-containing protein n=1 Tax=Neofusicoccum ribis TaxID=45134 RepID=A0ABR3SC45_9PEZI
MAPPEGATTEYVNPEDISGPVYTSGLACTIIAFCIVCLRLYTRLAIKHFLGDDDDADYGLGIHLWNVSLESYSPHFLKWEMAASVVYAPAVACTKISILLFYRRLSPGRVFAITAQGITFFLIAYSVCSIFTLIFGCLPVRAIYDLTAPKSRCINRNAAILALSIVNIVINIVMLLLPLQILIPLHIPKRQKLALTVVFLIGAFACASSIVRTVLLIPLFKSPDFTWNVVDQYVWAFIEINTSIVCASIPPLKPLFSRYLPVVLGGQHGSDVSKKSDALREGGEGYTLSSVENSGKIKAGIFGAKPSMMTGTIVGGRGDDDNQSTEEIRYKGHDMGTESEEQSFNAGDIRIIRTTELDVTSVYRTTTEVAR